MFNTIDTLKLKKIRTQYRTEYVRYYVENNLEDYNDGEYKYISDTDVCLVINDDDFYSGYRNVWVGHKCIDYEDNEYVLYNDGVSLSTIKNIYRQLKKEGKLNILYFI